MHTTAITPGFIVALVNAAKRAQTTAGWNSAKPFFALSPDAFFQATEDVDCPDEPDPLNLPLPELPDDNAASG